MVDRGRVSLPAIGSGALSMGQSQAQWDAITSIKSTTPFSAERNNGDPTASVSSGFDAMLSGYNAQAQLLAAAAPQDGPMAELLGQIQAAQQSTIDLFA